VDSLGAVQRLFTMFPLGAAGVGLLLLRLSAAGMLLFVVLPRTQMNSSQWAVGTGVVLAALMLLGVFTPVLCTVFCGLEIAALFQVTGADMRCVLFAAVHAAGLGLLGPGGYSLDARMFGRRRVILSTESK
jgi:hypothetical protein